jgi:hypothetical protein
MQIKNPERLFVTGRSRIVNIVDEESGQRTINEFKRRRIWVVGSL